MRTCTALFLLLITAIMVCAEYLHDSFETYPEHAYISVYDGWSTLGELGRTGIIITHPVSSGSQAMELPYAAGTTLFNRRALAGYTDFIHPNPTNSHPVIRASVMLYRQNLNQQVSMNLGNRSNQVVTVKSNLQRTRIVVNSYTTAVNFVVGEYANLTLYYDIDQHLASLDYAGTNIMPWRSVGSSSTNTLNAFSLRRDSVGLGTEGMVAFDEVVVETFPRHTWAWWRFERETYRMIPDRTGRFLPSERPSPGSTSRWVQPSWNMLSVKGQPYHNRQALQQFHTSTLLVPTQETGIQNFWTLEMIVKIAPAQDATVSLFEWGEPNEPQQSTNSWIAVQWEADSNLRLNLREMSRPDTNRETKLFTNVLPADDRWHHLAVVKSGSQLRMYVDYDFLVIHDLGDAADDLYAFNTTSRSVIGQRMQPGATTSRSSENTSADEIRFSWDALGKEDFLQLDQPYLSENVSIQPTTPWYLYAATQPLKYYQAETRVLGPSSQWSPNGARFYATRLFSRIPINMPGNRAVAFRLVEE